VFGELVVVRIEPAEGDVPNAHAQISDNGLGEYRQPGAERRIRVLHGRGVGLIRLLQHLRTRYGRFGRRFEEHPVR
jgi:hypothetical protein